MELLRGAGLAVDEDPDRHRLEVRTVIAADLGPAFGPSAAVAAAPRRQLQPLLDEKESDELRRAAHSIKGSSSNIGAMKLAGICQKIEDLAHSGDLANVAGLITDVETEYSSVKAVLETYL